jgi:hypothetical protein
MTTYIYMNSVSNIDIVAKIDNKSRKSRNVYIFHSYLEQNELELF